MTLRANFQKSYLIRYAVLSAVCLFMAAWFAYDGFVGYPQQIVYAEEYDKLEGLEPAERQAKWQEIASENGWPTDKPEKSAKELEDSILGQYIYGALALAAGLPALVLYLRARGSWVEETPTGVTTSWGQSVDFADVTQLNKKKWREKGIAKASYQVDGAGKTFVFDDFKFEREPLGQMLRQLEEVLKPEQIVGGPPESELDEASQEDDADDYDVEDNTHDEADESVER